MKERYLQQFPHSGVQLSNRTSRQTEQYFSIAWQGGGGHQGRNAQL